MLSVGRYALSMVALLAASPALANPMLAPTANYVMDVEVTRDSDHQVRAPMRYAVVGRKLAISHNSLVLLCDLERKEFSIMIPRVRVYSKSGPIKGDAIDSRRWTGVEAASADYVATERLLDRDVRKYRVQGKIFENQMPFEGDVWTTAENIVVKVDGTSMVGKIATPVKVTPVQIQIGNVDPAAVSVPKGFRRASIEEVYSADDDR